MITYRFLAFGDSPPRGMWDQELLQDIFKDNRFVDATGVTIPTVNGLTMHKYGAIVVLPGAYQSGYIKQINSELGKYEWVVLIVTSDEEGKFPVEDINHPNIKTYVQYPKVGRHDKYAKWPLGYTPETRADVKFTDKPLDWFFSGQNTHKRRNECIERLRRMENGTLIETEGFTQGLKPSEYFEQLSAAKVAPAPSGPVSADSFRLYEALEAGCIPIGDNISPKGDKQFWRYMFGDVPFPTINDYSDLPGYTEDQLIDWKEKANRVQAWWIKKKRDLKQQLIQDVADLSGKRHNEAITVVIPVSPIKSHPDTKILDETISTIRAHLNCEIIVTFDGVRSEQEERRDDYEEFIRRALWKCSLEWNATPIIFDKHMHQTGMAKAVIDEIKTPTLLYCEQDTPLTPDLPIDFKICVEKILSGQANVIRYHFESVIPKEHEHMIIGEEDNFIRTVQWSQRPHLASVAYYRHILNSYFSENTRSFIEDKMHSIVYEDYLHDGVMGWNLHKLYIYKPEDHLKRSYHTDGREGADKFDKSQVF